MLDRYLRRGSRSTSGVFLRTMNTVSKAKVMSSVSNTSKALLSAKALKSPPSSGAVTSPLREASMALRIIM